MKSASTIVSLFTAVASGEYMGAWEFLADVLLAAAGFLLLICLAWAAVERGRVHRRWTRLRQEAAKDAGAQVVEWCVAVGPIAGCV